MKAFYDKLGEKKFRLFAVISCFVGDLMLSKYLYDKYADRQSFDLHFPKAMQMLKSLNQQQKMNLNFPPDFQENVYSLIVNTLLTCLAIYLLFHIFNYIFYIYKKRFAHLYLTFLSFTATLFAPLMGLAVMSQAPVYGTLFILQGVLFFFVAYGTRIFKILPK